MKHIDLVFASNLLFYNHANENNNNI